ncbi:hypothetical protein DdX_06690 [Ditylenchus destructor]|uniref:Uncharacterized protein n=1 Tax=Ditylenchus destructor TaxID=166010 RepID=A0AAD4NBH0_9BILA|nr:hypothetical protein DdX_06690 [Ditylenchus destructor]
MDANVDERESEEASIEIEDLYKLAKRYVLPMISLRLTVYYPVEVLFHASTNMGKILDDRVLLAKNGHATGHSKSPISKLRGVFFFAKGADDTKWTISRFGNQLLRVIPRSLLNTEYKSVCLVPGCLLLLYNVILVLYLSICQKPSIYFVVMI